MAEPGVGGRVCETGKFDESVDKLVKKDVEDAESAVPLNTPWTFWVEKATQNQSDQSDYEANLQKVYTVSTVQDFWGVFNNIPDVSDLSLKYIYSLMRGNIKPLWEDEHNRRGGAWRMRCLKPDTSRIWKELVLAIIGEQLAECVAQGDEICGLRVSVRETIDVVEIWHSETSLSEKATVVRKVHQLLPDINFQAIFYKAHFKN